MHRGSAMVSAWVRLNKRGDGSYVCLVGAEGSRVPLMTKGPMTRVEAEMFMRGLYRETGAGAETAAYHGIEVQA